MDTESKLNLISNTFEGIWACVRGFPDYYVSDDGRVSSTKRVRPVVLKSATDKDGYLRVMLCRQSEKVFKPVHQLVLETHVGSRPRGYHASHVDGCRVNNRVENLVWESPTMNERRKVRHGTSNRGEGNGRCKLTVSKVKKILTLIEKGKTRDQISKIMSISKTTVSRIKSGDHWALVKIINERKTNDTTNRNDNTS